MRRTGTTALALPATVLVSCLWVVVACALGSPSAPPLIGQASPTPAVATPSPTSAPTAAAGATASATPTTSAATAAAGATASATPTTSATATAPNTATPPTGNLAAGALNVGGHLGSYCWADACSDEFELRPKSSLPTIHLPAGTPLEFTLADGSGFAQWDASYSTAKMSDLVPLDSGGSAYDPDSSATPPPDLLNATFAAPPKGDWVLVVSIHFKDGSAVYSWHVNVE